MKQEIIINNVSIGDKFRPTNTKNTICEVVDFLECRSMVTGAVTGYVCIAKGITGMATNTFEIPFATVVRNRIN